LDGVATLNCSINHPKQNGLKSNQIKSNQMEKIAKRKQLNQQWTAMMQLLDIRNSWSVDGPNQRTDIENTLKKDL
jgi:hypothetical protein